MSRNACLLRGFVGFLVLASPAFGQDVERVRSLYVAAAYEEALAAIPAVGVDPVRTDLEQYRALSLLALGREQDAIESLERLVREYPTFVPPAEETSPRMQAMFSDVRSRLVPESAKKAYVDAKAAYEAKDREAAGAGFRRTLDLIASLPEAEIGALADLRLLAAEFLELAAARPAAPASPATAANPVPVPPLPTQYVRPVVINEQMPPWNPPAGIMARSEYVGVIRVQIGSDGRVESASIVKGSHPVYDAAVLAAAKRWTYKPATSGGQPVPAERDIQIRLVPR